MMQAQVLSPAVGAEAFFSQMVGWVSEVLQTATQSAAGHRALVRGQVAPDPRRALSLVTYFNAHYSVVLIDASPSMRCKDCKPTRLAAARDAAVQFVEACANAGRGDHVAIVAFNRRARRMCGWLPVAEGKVELLEAIHRITIAYCTSIGAGLLDAEKLLSGEHRGLTNKLLGRCTEATPPDCVKRIVLLTDGEHNSDPEPLQASRCLKRAGVTIDCIGIGAREEVDEVLLRKIASRENGRVRYRFITDKDELLEHYRRLGGHHAIARRLDHGEMGQHPSAVDHRLDDLRAA